MSLPINAGAIECPQCSMILYRQRFAFNDQVTYTHCYMSYWGCSNEGRVFGIVKGVMKFLWFTPIAPDGSSKKVHA